MCPLPEKLRHSAQWSGGEGDLAGPQHERKGQSLVLFFLKLLLRVALAGVVSPEQPLPLTCPSTVTCSARRGEAHSVCHACVSSQPALVTCVCTLRKVAP